MKIIPSPRYWSAHTHSRYSVNDALPEVKHIVARAHELGQKGLALTDHGNMAGSIELYTECAKVGIKAFPGSELYFVPDMEQYKRDYRNKHLKAQRYHLGVMAYTSAGYEHLVRLSTASHANFFHKPTVDWRVLSQLADDEQLGGLAITTGCHFGYLVQQLMHHGEDAAKRYLYQLQAYFKDSVYVEVQNHHITHEEEGWTDEVVADVLVGLARELGLPVVITQDSHYVGDRDRGDHEALKRLVAFGPDPDDAVFPGDGFHMVDDRWMREHHRADTYQRGVEGLDDLLDRHDLRIGVLDSYAYSVPQIVHDPQEVLRGRIGEQLLSRSTLNRAHEQKVFEELQVIETAGMSGYMVLVAQVCDWMRQHSILYQTRGSAAGSMVCWLLGISNLDPIKWDLRFERFLSSDRTKPPDVDLDMAHDRRQELVDWLNTKFVAHQIGTWAKYSIDKEDAEKGSLLVRYFATKNKQGADVGTFEDIPVEDRAMLERLSKRKLFKGMGTNAAGVVLTSTREEFDRLVPLAWMVRSSGDSGFVTQYGKDDIEALGLVKLDVLGSKTLTVMERTMANLGLDPGKLDDIQFGDKPTFNLMRSGKTDGVFQLEGNSTKWGLRDLKPTKIEDIIAAMALFRPAAMKTGGTKAFIDRKHKRKDVPRRHSLLAPIVAPTYGVLLYQEQVIDMLRALGMGADDLTKFLKAVKASNKEINDAAEVIGGYQAWIQARCREEGFNEEDLRFLDEAIAGFAEYGFNRAHASVYGITAYRCAYLAARHPVEFHAALLGVAAGTEKEAKYLAVTRKRGVRILKADVNISGATYSVDGRAGAVRRGLLAIHGVGSKSAEVLAGQAPYRSVQDLIDRTPNQPITGGKDYRGDRADLGGVLRALQDAGALDSLPDVLDSLPNLQSECE